MFTTLLLWQLLCFNYALADQATLTTPLRALSKLSGPPSALFNYYAYKYEAEALPPSERKLAPYCKPSKGPLCTFDEFLRETMPETNRNGAPKGGKRKQATTPYVSGKPELQTFFPAEEHLQMAVAQGWKGMTDTEDRLFSKGTGPKTGAGYMKAMQVNINYATAMMKLNHNEISPAARKTLIQVTNWLSEVIIARMLDSEMRMFQDFEKFYKPLHPDWDWKLTNNVYMGQNYQVADIEKTLYDYRATNNGKTPMGAASIDELERSWNTWHDAPVDPNNIERDKKSALTHLGVINAAMEAHAAIIREC